MRAIEGVLKEELGRLLQLKKSYLREISKLSRGSICEKKIKKNKYPYLVFREGSRVVYEYIGKLSDLKIKKLASEIEQRRKYEKLLREVNFSISRLEKIVYGRKRPV